ncbi:MAG: hypothetical protein PF517_12385 [Salinivirgaceae bacterium]|jgi:hypothetical protein|nr:hypothetical protein [Salinivirgaceae bacterium]
MADTAIVAIINSVIEEYFTRNTSLTIVPVKELMPAFISAGIFTKDIRKGLPIRKILKELDETNQLHLIPLAFAERKKQTTYWYFIPSNAAKPTIPYKQEQSNLETKAAAYLRLKNDEAYVIDLCDEVLKQKAIRQKKFGFLLGDVHKNGKSQTKIPVDAYYEDLQLAVDYKVKEHFEPESTSKHNDKDTVSGMPRSEQRIRYDLRKAKTLPSHGITLICISNSDFSRDDKNKIIRNTENDIKIVQKALSSFITSDK